MGQRRSWMRIGESKLEAARERIWSRPYNSLDPMVVSLEQEHAPLRRRAIRLAIAAAIVAHIVLFFIVFPSYYEEKILKVGSTPRVYKLRAVKFQQPPKPKVQQRVSKPKARAVPVPDATPDDPEPIAREESVDVSDLDFPEVGDSVVIPDGPAGPAIGPMQISGNVLAPVRIYSPDPHYPEEARHARVQGVVILQTIINTDGNVTDVKVLKGLPSGLTEAAVAAVSSWRFKPATLEGRPVAVYYLVTVSFSVQ